MNTRCGDVCSVEMRFVIVGGGVAGVSCAQRLRRLAGEEDEVVVISASPTVKTVHNWNRVGQFTELFDVGVSSCLEDGIRLVTAEVRHWNWNHKEVILSTGETIAYDRLCIATGAVLTSPFPDPRVLSVRDTDSAAALSARLADARSVLLIGNGGIATELVYELSSVSITWAIRDSSPCSVFFEPPVAEWLRARILAGRHGRGKTDGVQPRVRYAAGPPLPAGQTRGCALGPDWSSAVQLRGRAQDHCVDMRVGVSVEWLDFLADDRVSARLSDGSVVECDAVVAATGVTPNSALWKAECEQLCVSSDGGISVDAACRSSVPVVYACGDVCTAEWNKSADWKQMRLWTQARQLGEQCADGMLMEAESEGAWPTGGDPSFCFELFAHATTFCGYKVVFLGDFRAERQPEGWYAVERTIGDEEYVRCVMYNGRVKGAVLIGGCGTGRRSVEGASVSGESGLEETLENLILNGTDVSSIQADFLDPSIDIEDYFD